MSTLDIILLIFLAYGAFRGFRKGLVMEIVTILALIIGIIGAFKLLHQGMAFLDKHFEIGGTILPYVSFIIIFIIIVILINVLGKSVKKVLDMTLLGSFDNMVGAIIGMLKWAFAISVIIWLSNAVSLTFPDDWVSGSFLYPLIEPVAPITFDFLAYIFPFLKGLVDNIGELLQSNV